MKPASGKRRNSINFIDINFFEKASKSKNTPWKSVRKRESFSKMLDMDNIFTHKKK